MYILQYSRQYHKKTKVENSVYRYSFYFLSLHNQKDTNWFRRTLKAGIQFICARAFCYYSYTLLPLFLHIITTLYFTFYESAHKTLPKLYSHSYSFFAQCLGPKV